MTSIRPPADHFSLLYFASASSFTRKTHEFFLAPLEVDRLFDLLEEKYPGIKAQVLESCAITVNLDYVDLDDSTQSVQIIQGGDEVAIIPPVSSG